MNEIFGELNVGTLLVLILGLVEFVKKFGVTGNALTAASAAIGMLLCAVYQLGVMYPEWAPWVAFVVYFLFGGLAASGLYDLGKRAAGWLK